MKNAKTVKKRAKVFLKIFGALLAVIMLYLVVVRVFLPLPESESDFKANRNFNLENAIENVPEEYFNETADGGTLEAVEYKTAAADKRAIVYLPPGYTDNKQYDIIYLQGGANSTEETYFGTPENPKPEFKNMLDNMINRGNIKPIIAVCANFYNKSRSETGVGELIDIYQSYCNEVRENLIPAVESRYSTYAESVDDAALVASRGHRAFGGYSMGAAIAWNMFINNLDLFYYYIPNCGGMQIPYIPHLFTDAGEELNAAVEKFGYTPDDYFIYSTVGTLDITFNSTRCVINDLYKNYGDNFIFTQDNTQNGNITFKVKNFAFHGFPSAIRNYYNALPAIFG